VGASGPAAEAAALEAGRKGAVGVGCLRAFMKNYLLNLDLFIYICYLLLVKDTYI